MLIINYELLFIYRHNPGWKKNSAGYWFNPRFGFGLMNANSLVQAAANWTNVPKKIECAFKSHQR